MTKDSNPETDVLGLDPGRLVGLDVEAIRNVIGREECVLVVATEGVPAGWPPEILETGIDRRTGQMRIQWCFQTADGRWLHHARVLRPGPLATGDPVPAYVYTRRPLRTPETRVRPIIEVTFGADGRCQRASAAVAEFLLRNRLQMAALLHAGTLTVPEAGVPDPTAPGPDVAEELLRAMGLEPPQRQWPLQGVPCREGVAGLMRWSWTRGLDGLGYDDARGIRRLAVNVPHGGPPRLTFVEEAGGERSQALDSEGLRVVLADADATPRFRFDVYGALPRQVLTAGGPQALEVIVVGRAVTSSGHASGTATGLVVLAGTKRPLPAAEPRLQHEPMSNRLRIRAVPPASFKILHLVAVDDPPSFAAVGLRWD